jgi:hypothetical protein
MAKEEEAGLVEERKTCASNAMQPHVRLKARIRLPALKTQVSAFSTFAPCEKMAARLILAPLPAAPRAHAALSAASGRSPRKLGGFSMQALASSGARSAMSPSGETPPGRGQVGLNKRLRLRHPAPLPARKQSDIYSVCFQQESQANKVLLLCRSMPVALLLFVAHARCTVAICCSMPVALLLFIAHTYCALDVSRSMLVAL